MSSTTVLRPCVLVLACALIVASIAEPDATSDQSVVHDDHFHADLHDSHDKLALIVNRVKLDTAASSARKMWGDLMEKVRKFKKNSLKKAVPVDKGNSSAFTATRFVHLVQGRILSNRSNSTNASQDGWGLVKDGLAEHHADDRVHSADTSAGSDARHFPKDSVYGWEGNDSDSSSSNCDDYTWWQIEHGYAPLGCNETSGANSTRMINSSNDVDYGRYVALSQGRMQSNHSSHNSSNWSSMSAADHGSCRRCIVLHQHPMVWCRSTNRCVDVDTLATSSVPMRCNGGWVTRNCSSHGLDALASTDRDYTYDYDYDYTEDDDVDLLVLFWGALLLVGVIAIVRRRKRLQEEKTAAEKAAAEAGEGLEAPMLGKDTKQPQVDTASGMQV